jgi:peptidoglycan/LPS O-acetylase OafA/YrhL
LVTQEVLQPGPLRNRLRSIDVLRGAASLAVVFYHAVRYADLPANSPAAVRAIYAVCSQGHLGVPLFFVISGFCIHLGWANRFQASGQATIDWFAFWRRRMRRLYPAYVVALLLAMAFVVAAYFLRPNQAIVTQYPQPRLPWIGLDFVAHLLMLHGLVPMFDSAGGNPVFWTLAREEYLYAMYAALLVFRRRLGLGRSVILVATVGIVFQTVVFAVIRPEGQVANTLYSTAIGLWIQWCLGFLAAEHFAGNCKLPALFKSLWAVPPLWALAAVATEYFPPLAPSLWGLTFFVLLNAAVKREVSGRWPAARALHWLAGVGVFSYSLYLIHIPARTVVKYVAIYLHLEQASVLAYCLTVAACVIAGYYSARVFFWLVEGRCISSAPSARVEKKRAAAAVS